MSISTSTTPGDQTASEEGPDHGHTFRLTARSRGSYTVAGDPRHTDAPDFGPPMLAVEVRAWSLPQALRKAAELPLSAWVPDDAHESSGQVAYEAYCASTGWKSAVSGAQLPAWGDQSEAIRDAWEAAGRAVAEECGR